MRALLVTALLCLLATGAALAPPIALADGKDVVKDCTDNGRLDREYSQSEYQEAQRNIPTDVDEYTDCRDVIRRAQLAGRRSRSRARRSQGTPTPGPTAGGGSPPPAAGSADPASAPVSADERRALDDAVRGGGGPVSVAGRTVTPGASSFTAEDVRHSLPGPVVALLVLLGAGGVAGATLAVRRRVLARRQA